MAGVLGGLGLPADDVARFCALLVGAEGTDAKAVREAVLRLAAGLRPLNLPARPAA